MRRCCVPSLRCGRCWIGRRMRCPFLTEALHESRAQANRDVAAARALMSGDAELPRMAEALAWGEVSPEHVTVAVSTLRQVPKALKTKPVEPGEDGRPRAGAEVIDEVVTASPAGRTRTDHGSGPAANNARPTRSPSASASNHAYPSTTT